MTRVLSCVLAAVFLVFLLRVTTDLPGIVLTALGLSLLFAMYEATDNDNL